MIDEYQSDATASPDDVDSDRSDQIAIIGMTGRFPGAKDIDAFWRNLRDGVESITFFSAETLTGSNIDPTLLSNPKYVGADGIIEDMDLFDAEFFSISPGEAELMDPQHRLFLECAWELMEQAGYDSESYAGRVAVYGSANLSTYLIRNIMTNPELRERATSFQTLITNDKDYIATRVSYKLNLRGPSLSVATLCSSSFVAIHLACQTLLNYQCDLALAGAAALQASRNETFFYQEGGIGDPDGHCRAFDARASGTVSGSGLGIVALKRLADALEDGDYIHAVIRSTAINNDGAIKYSYTAPSVDGQADVIAEALSLAEVDPDTITYVETHGTGTQLGDPIEVAALSRAFYGCGAQGKQYCAIGSVKTNIGHLVNAGGVASLIKTVLAMQHGQIPASLNFDRPNPEIDFANSPFYVATQLAEWKTDGFPRRAGVSSFGIGGTNVHMIVEEAPARAPSGQARPWQALVLSARTSAALEQQTRNLLAYLTEHPAAKLADVAFTLQVGRRGLEHRRALLCRDAQDAIAALSARDPERVWTQFQETRDRPVAFMLADLADVGPNLGRALYQSEPAFRAALDNCAELLEPTLGVDLRDLLYPEPTTDERPTTNDQRPTTDHRPPTTDKQTSRQADKQTRQSPISNLQSPNRDETQHSTLNTQNSSLLLDQTQYAQPALFAIEYALAQLWMEWGVKPQALLGVGVGEYVAACLAGVFSLEIALALVAGDRRVDRASLQAPQIPLVSNATGAWMSEAEATRLDYWLDRAGHRRASSECLKPLLAEPEQVLLEVGWGSTLHRLVAEHPDKAERQVVLASLPQQPADQAEIEPLLATVCHLWLAGVLVDWYGFHQHERRRRLPLPTYPFERKRYWIEPYKPAERAAADGAQPEAMIRKPDIADWFYVPGWKTAPLPQARPLEQSDGPWLLFVDELGLGAAQAERLRQASQTVVSVVAGAGFSRQAEAVYTLDVRQQADYRALLAELAASGNLPRRIVHLWNITASEEDRLDSEGFTQAQDRGFYSLLFLAQALAEQPASDAVQLWVISNQTQHVESADLIRPEKTTILGMCKVIPQENAQVTCRHIDITLPANNASGLGDLGQLLLAEILADGSETTLAYRGRRRWLHMFEPLQLADTGESIRPLREHGVYLISSGLSDISLALARYLASAVRARLVVIENQAFPKREAWDSWLRNEPEHSTSFKIASVRQLEQAGAEVLVVNADLVDAAQVRDALAQATERFGAINGLIHAVSDIGDSTFTTIQDMDRTAGIGRFELRMRGLYLLQEALAERGPDMCVLVSSLAAVLGGVGQAAYAAANLFLDAFAGRHGPPWLSINWDAWQFEADQSRIAALTPRLAQFAIAPAQGAQAFERILSRYTGDQIVVSTADLQARMQRWLGIEPPADLGMAQATRKRHARPHLSTPYVAPTSELDRTLAAIWQETLGIEKIGIDDNFFDLGGDSLIAVKTITRLEKALQMKVPVANLYQTPSIRALTGLLAQDQAASTQQRAAQLDQRRETLSRRNAYLHQRLKERE